LFSNESVKPVVSFRYQAPPRQVPPTGVADFDLENWNDPLQCSEYAMEIFNYYKSREVKRIRVSNLLCNGFSFQFGTGFGDPKVSACDPKVGLEKHCSKPV